jgi:uncharacterized membrane protein AbrB (regulator of aidB expression)
MELRVQQNSRMSATCAAWLGEGRHLIDSVLEAYQALRMSKRYDGSTSIWVSAAGGIMPSDASCVGQNAAVVAYQQGS